VTLWEFLSWVANCQLAGNEVNILGIIWAVMLTWFGYKRFRSFQTVGFSSVGLNDLPSKSVVVPILLAGSIVVWVQSIIDVGLITPIAIVFGRWVELESLVGSLSLWSFIAVYWNVLITIILFTLFFWSKGIYKLLHVTKYSLLLLLIMIVFYASILQTFGVWNYSLLTDPLRTVFFWCVYPEIRMLWGLLFISLLKNPPRHAIDANTVKAFYVEGERYDWVTDPKFLEERFHAKREKETMHFINNYSSNSTVLDVGCGTGRITRR